MPPYQIVHCNAAFTSLIIRHGLLFCSSSDNGTLIGQPFIGGNHKTTRIRKQYSKFDVHEDSLVKIIQVIKAHAIRPTEERTVDSSIISVTSKSNDEEINIYDYFLLEIEIDDKTPEIQQGSS